MRGREPGRVLRETVDNLTKSPAGCDILASGTVVGSCLSPFTSLLPTGFRLSSLSVTPLVSSAEPVPTEGGTRRVNGESETRPDRRRER